MLGQILFSSPPQAIATASPWGHPKTVAIWTWCTYNSLKDSEGQYRDYKLH